MHTPKKTRLINIRKEPQGFDAWIGRPGLGFGGYFGNPYKLYRDGTREECYRRFKTYFVNRIAKDEEYRNRVQGLKGARLGCICTNPTFCHGTIIVNYLNSQP